MNMLAGSWVGALVILVNLYQIEGKTTKPIIGIICHEIGEQRTGCYLPASYVKAVEAAGARVAPIFLWRKPEYYRKMVKSVNGIVFPGGDAKYDVVGGYFQSASIIFSYARKINYEGDHFPILGVCLGMEFLSIYSNNMDPNKTLELCQGVGRNSFLPLEFTSSFRNSSLYSRASDEIIEILAKQPVTPNYHAYCLRPENQLRHPWHILSVNKDGQGKYFVSSMETDGPMAAIQFHPEKNAFEWEQNQPSFKDALLAARHFYDWLVTEARLNDHHFTTKEVELKSLIYQFNPTYTGNSNCSFTQKYLFTQ